MSKILQKYVLKQNEKYLMKQKNKWFWILVS